MNKPAGLIPLFPLLFAGALLAHHGNAAYDETVRVPIKGTVTEFVWTNPHSQIYVNVKDASGKVVNWGVETNSPGLLGRAGWTRRSIKAGDQVTIILCPAKNGQPVAYAGSGDPGTKVIFADGHELDFVDKTIDKTADKTAP
ncbi:MAG TPA: DUF6152 family protein [Bryobacteraceae bacterium]|jgi:hypothetical protein